MARNVAGGVVRGADLFGREAEIQELWRRIGRGSVLLTGPRRWGKSSVMCALHDAPLPGWQVVMVDVEYISTPAELLIELGAEVLQRRGLSERLRAQAGQLPRALAGWFRGVLEEVEVGAEFLGTTRIKLREALPTPDRWEVLAPELLLALSRLDSQVLIILDELPVMLSNLMASDDAAALRFLRWFRAQRQMGPSNIRFLIGGSVNIEPTLERLGQQAVLNDLERFHLDPFPRGRAERFVQAVLDGEGATPAEGVVRRIGFSHYQTRLREHYGRLEAPARVVLELVGATPAGREEHEVRETLRREGWTDEELDAVLVALEGDYYVARDGGHIRFSHGFLRRWWLRNAPVAGRTR